MFDAITNTTKSHLWIIYSLLLKTILQVLNCWRIWQFRVPVFDSLVGISGNFISNASCTTVTGVCIMHCVLTALTAINHSGRQKHVIFFISLFNCQNLHHLWRDHCKIKMIFSSLFLVLLFFPQKNCPQGDVKSIFDDAWPDWPA